MARREADAARADAANLLGEMAALEDRQKYYAALGASAFAIAVGGLGAVALLARRQQTAALNQAVQALADAKRHAALDLQKAKRFAAEPLAKALVPVFDNLDSLCDACSADAALDEGAQLTRSSLMAALQAQSIERVEPEEGTAFDPHVPRGDVHGGGGGWRRRQRHLFGFPTGLRAARRAHPPRGAGRRHKVEF